VDHHDDWTHWPPEPDPHEGDLGGHDALDGLGHDGLGGHDPLDGYDTDPGHDPYGGHDDAVAGYGDDTDLRHDADLVDLPGRDLSGHDPTDPQPSIMDGHAAAGAGVDEHLFGVDHDLPPGDADAYFPPPLDLPDRPEPVDGYPWSDPATLGDTGTGWPEPVDSPDSPGSPPMDDLLSYAGMDPPATGDGWAALVDSDDPAVSALARWWGPVS